MSDQNIDSKEKKNEPEAALNIEIVSVEEAEAEAADARAFESPEQLLMQQELAQQMSEVLNQIQTLVGDETEVGEKLLAKPNTEESNLPLKGQRPASPVAASRQAKVVKKGDEIDALMFDEADNFLQEPSPAALANQVDIENIEGLTEIVLDAASAANEAAHSTNQSIHMLLGSVATINKMAKSLRKSNNYVLGFILSLGLVGLLSGAVMLYVLQSAIKDASAVNLAMATKLVQFEQQMDRVNLLEAQLIDVADVSHQLGQGLEQVMYYLRQVGTDSQQAASQQATENQVMLLSVNEQILTSFNDLQNTSKAQQGVLTQLKSRIDGLQLQMKTIQNQDLVGKVKALIALEQQRYFALEKEKLALETAKIKANAPPVEDTFITFGIKAE